MSDSSTTPKSYRAEDFLSADNLDRADGAVTEIFKMMFGFIQSQALLGPKYIKGESKGDNATLDYDGKDGDGNAMSSVVTMVREGGAWKVEKESSTTHSK